MLRISPRLEVLQAIEDTVIEISEAYLKPIEKCWQPADMMPDAAEDDFFERLSELQSAARELPYDFWVVLVGDTITEEALPTYEAWLMDLEGVCQSPDNAWSQWVRKWTAEENRHGDLLNRYLYLSGRVNMRQVEISTQHLIADGFDIGTSQDPYRTFVYTSFQELATNVSHRRVGKLAKDADNHDLAKICGTIASDEARHAKAYQEFVTRIFQLDASEMMLALDDMMRKRIVMPAGLMRESGESQGKAFAQFADAAQRIGVYTTSDYIAILESLLEHWKIETMTGLTDDAAEAQENLMSLPRRFRRIANRMPDGSATRRIASSVNQPPPVHKFKWVRDP